MTKLADHAKRLKDLQGLTVKTGWFEGNKYPDGMPVAAVARSNEFGGHGGPARPFMRKAQEDLKTVMPKAIDKAMRLAVDGTAGEKALGGTVGAVMERAIVLSIKEGEWAPNSPETIARKGFDKPLIDTGIMWQTVTTKIEKT